MMNPHVEVEIARRTLVDVWQGFAKNPGLGWGITRHTDRSTPELIKAGGFNRPQEIWQTLPTRILAASPHLQGYDVPGDEIDRLKAEGLTLVEALEMLGMG